MHHHWWKIWHVPFKRLRIKNYFKFLFKKRKIKCEQAEKRKLQILRVSCFLISQPSPSIFSSVALIYHAAPRKRKAFQKPECWLRSDTEVRRVEATGCGPA